MFLILPFLMLCFGMTMDAQVPDSEDDSIELVAQDAPANESANQAESPSTETLPSQDAPANESANQAESPSSEDLPSPTIVVEEIPDKIIDLVTSLTWFDFLMTFAFMLLGYLSPFIPGLRKIGDTETRVVMGAIVLIMIFVSMDISAAWKLALEFLASTKLYDYVFKLIKKTPDPALVPPST
jgi:hypothetical protein